MIKTRAIMKRKTLKLSELVLVTLVVLLCLIVGKLLFNWQEYRILREEISHLDTYVLQTSPKEVPEDMPQMSQLLMVIDECVKIFMDEEITVRSYNLERITEEGDSLTTLHGALIRLRVQGSWGGIERGLNRIENIPNRAVLVEEAILEKSGGEILLKIFYFGT